MTQSRYISLFLLLALLVTQVWAANAAPCPSKKLTILHTNDVHARLTPSFYKKKQEICGGAIERSGLINTIKAEVGAGNVLILDGGDLSQGTPYFTVFKGMANFSAAKLMGYDAITTGNHEYGNGIAALQGLIEATKLRVLCCNVVYKGTGKPVFQPYQVFVRGGVKIAVIGCIGEDAWGDVDMKIRAPLAHIHEIEAVKSYAKRLRPYVDLIALVSHTGIEDERELASQVGELDVIIGGHTHTALTNPEFVTNKPGVEGCTNGLNGTIMGQAGERGTYLGRIDLKISNNKTIDSFSGKLIKVEKKHGQHASKDLRELVNKYENLLKQEMDRVVGQSAKELPYGARGNFIPSGFYTAEAMRYVANADLCVINSGGVKTSIPKGNITVGDIYTAIPYDNNVVNFTVKGKEIKRTLDYLAANHDNYEGLQYAGITFVLNLIEKKSQDIKINDKPLELEKDYIFATTSFMANGNDCGDIFFKNVSKIDNLNVYMREAAVKYTEAIKNLPDFTIPNYRFIK
jgi:5'-nucleotidase/UDP-sugar diphosphatase